MKLKSLSILLLLLVVFAVQPLVSAQAQGNPPAQTNVNLDVGYTIQYPKYEYLPQNQAFTLHTHVFNRSTGLPVHNGNVECNIHLYAANGTHLFKGLMSYTHPEFEIDINENNFTEIGPHSYIIWCNSTDFGGFASGVFEVTYQGQKADTPQSMIYFLGVGLLLILFVFTIFAYMKLPSDNPKDDYGQLLSISHLKYLRIPLIGIAWFLFLAINFIVSGIARNFLFDGSIANIFFSIFTIQMRLTIPFLIVIFLYLLIEIFRDKELSGLMKRGLPSR